MEKRNIARLRWQRAWLPLTVIVLIGLLAYSNTWRSPFVFDDIHLLVENDARRSLNFSLQRWFGTRTLPVFTFDLNYYFGRLNVVHYHAVNIAIHLISSAAMFWLAYLLSSLANKTVFIKIRRLELTNHLLMAMIASLIFVAHPVQTQAVTYIVQRLASMATMFYIFALLFYLKFRLETEDQPKKIWAGLSLLSTLAAMHSKETSITLPVAIVLLELLIFAAKPVERRFWKIRVDWRKGLKRAPYILPWLITIIVIPAYMLGVKDLYFSPEIEAEPGRSRSFTDVVNVKRAGDVSVETVEIPRTTYLLTQINVVRKYWQLVVWPAGLNIDHDVALTTGLFNRPTLLSLSLHFGWWILAIILFKRGRVISAFGIMFFYLALLPESSIIPIIDVIFEHRLYLPMVGISLVMADLIQAIVQTKWAHRRVAASHALSVILAVVLILSLAVTTYARNRVWRDDVSLWEDSVKKSPNKARPHNNLGKAYLDRKMFDQSRDLYLRELELDPNSVSGHNNLGSILAMQGKHEEAIAEINKALELRPDHDSAFNNLGNVYMLQGRYEEAEQAYRKSIELNAKDAGVWRNLGDVLVSQQKYDEAIEVYRRAIGMVPENALWHSKLGAALGALGRYEEAKEELIIAIQINPGLNSAYSNLGNVFVAERNLDEAIRAYVTYLQLEPNDTGVMNNLAKVFLQKGMKNNAKEIFEKVLEIDAENAEAKKYLGSVSGDAQK